MPDLGKAYVQIIPSAEGISGQITKAIEGEVTSAGEIGGQSMMDSMLGAVKGVGIAAVVKTMYDGISAAVSEYADYEQLTGGVETLFADSADTVIANAEDAYKTAGMSANEYMETVTSFSASLLSSLGGDTVAAAEYADMAISDMSDNANKFGTDISSIENAYQGFSKQNFTMLDNLKLGYGGTKTEMERLLSDAEAIKLKQGEVADYSIESYADIVEAIHVVQDEMGITGTTASEASETISGSIASAEAAVTNLVTGLGNADADLVGLMDDAGQAVLTAAGNVVEAVGTVLTAPVRFIEQATDPVNRVSRAMDDVADAQDRIASTQNILDLVDQYNDLRSQLDDANTSAAEAEALEEQLTIVRQQLADATGNAAIAQGEYGQTLDDLVESEQAAAEIEAERANMALYDSLVAGSSAYKDELSQSKQLTQQLADAEEDLGRAREAHEDPEAYYGKMVAYLDDLNEGVAAGTIGWEEYSAGLGELAEMYEAYTGMEPLDGFFSMPETAISSLQWMGDSVSESFRSAYSEVEDLGAALDRISESTSEYETGVMSLVQDGIIPAEEGADLLGTTMTGLGYMLQEYTRDAAEASSASADLGGSTDAAADAATDSLQDIANAATAARLSGVDLRDSYNMLSAELEKVGDSGDEATREFAEIQLAALNLAATNQELIESYPELVSQLGETNLSNLSAWLVENGLTAEEWGSKVTEATSNVVNGFGELDTSLDMSLDEMAANMRSNIQAYTDWEANIQTLMDAAVESGDEAQIAFVQYMADMGIGAAEQVAAMAADTETALDEFGSLFSEAMDAGMVEVYQSIENTNVETAASTLAGDVVDAIEGEDYSAAGTAITGAVADSITTGSSDMDAAMTEAVGSVEELVGDADLAGAMTPVMDNLVSTMDGVDFTLVGEGISTETGAGISSGESSVVSAAEAIVNSAYSGASGETSDFYWVGYYMDSGMASGLYGNESAVKNAARTVARAALNAAKQELGISSPSSVFRDEVGAWIPEGIAEGITAGTNVVTGSVSALADASVDAWDSSAMDMGVYSMNAARMADGYAGAGEKTVTITNNFTVNGAESPEAFADRLARRLNMQIRMA